jgi:phosphomannomutase/phosphoglucomutase
VKLAPEIFRAYDIRGIVGTTLTPEAVRAIGRALGALARERGAPTFAVGRDGRGTGPALLAALTEGLNAGGADAIDLGMVPTPVVYFAAHQLGCGSAVAVTGSHNPAEYNGLKMVVAGNALSGDEIQKLKSSAEAEVQSKKTGKNKTAEILDPYIDRIVGDVKLARPFRIAIDCGNGVAGMVAPQLYRKLGCEVTELFCDVDGTFPNHHPDPSRPENLKALVEKVKEHGLDLGLAFDGDADRLGVVTQSGRIIYPDRQLMLFSKDVLARNPGAEIIYDVKCTRLLGRWIERHGGRPVIWKTGHSLIKAKLKESGAPLAGEMSGHIFFKERWYGFDDALYCGARLLEILAREKDPTGALESLPDAPNTPELNWKLSEGEPHALIEQLKSRNLFPNALRALTIDGVRAEYADGFGLARASNTSPVIVLRFEGDTPEAMARIQDDFRKALQPLKPGAPLPF